jgi:predicted ATP-grasp superfamily ATP-dependent carboligase
MKWDVKTIAAVTGLISVLLGGVELRVSVAKLQSQVDRIEWQLQQQTRTAAR